MDDEEGEGENPSTIGSAANGPPPHRKSDGAAAADRRAMR